MKNIYINNELISLSLTNGKSGNSGTVYHLDNDKDLAIKIYHSSIKEDEYPWFPSEKDLDYFVEIASETSPILLSKYKVTNEDFKYIGCATSYIHETRGNTSDAIWSLPRDIFFAYFYNIIDKIPYFNEKQISLCDWSVQNIRLGKIKGNKKESLYIFDDSDYSIENEQTDNYIEMNNLVEDLIYNYINLENCDVKTNILKSVRKYHHYIDFLEKNSHGCSTIGEYMNHCIVKSKKQG